MRKWTAFLLTCLFALVLTACNSTATPIEKEDDTSKETAGETTKDENEEPKVSDLTLEEVYQKAMDRQNEIESLSSEVTMEQLMTIDGQEINVKSDMTMDMTMNPIAMYAIGNSTMFDPTIGEEVPMGYEMYMVEDGFFIYDEMSDTWMKLPADSYEQMMGQTANQADASQQLAMLQSFIEDFTFEQNDDQYILTLDASGEKFNDFVLEQALGTGAVSTEDQAVLESIKFNDMKYVLFISKETFDTEEITMNMEMTETTSGETVVMNTSMVFTNINGIDAIEVPQDIIDNAIEQSF
ncbi:Lipoprotein OS=Ureibacillus acetophenoni OX=614649 GN=SAMN05877842_111102 PE=4 SV=1 [Ureibacillus acetophenoni]